MMKRYNVKELYAIAHTDNKPLLSNFGLNNPNIHFWDDYRSNFAKYDALFKRLYNSFIYTMSDSELQGISQAEFTDDVERTLMLHSKRYEELYRVNVVSDTDDPLTYNYDMTEKMDRSTNQNGAVTSGQRTDINLNEIGSQNIGTVNKVTGWNSGNENTSSSGTQTEGSRNDITQFTKGQETDTNVTAGSEEYTLTRKGNIGVQTAGDMMRIHKAFWSTWEFYQMIFDDICTELLAVGGDYLD